MSKIKHIDLFSGIGGFALAADRVFGEVEHIFCDNEPFAQEVLKKHWPNSKIYGDIRTLTNTRGEEQRGVPSRQENGQGIPETWKGRVDILTGGFPCQPFSQAGKRKGTDDNRYLWPEMLRVIQEFQPTWVIAENVRGLLSINGGLVFEQVCTDLESAGYEVQPIVIPAVAVNAPHRRDRVWFVAHRNADSSGCVGRSQEEYTAKARKQAFNDSQGRHTDVTDTNGAGLQETWAEQQTAKAGGEGGNGRTGWDKDWAEVATALCGVFNGLSAELDSVGQIINDGIYSKYGTTFNKITRQDLPHLWHGFQSQAFQWSIGRFNTIQEQEYLFTVLWKFAFVTDRQNNVSFESPEVQKAFVQNMWVNGEIGCPSQGWGYSEQYFNEHRDSLSQLSYEVALVAKEVKDLYTKDRNPRLKALGNAIVPQVAEEIMKAIKNATR